MAPKSAPEPSLHTGYHPQFGHFSLPIPPALESQLILERSFPPSHLLAPPFASHVPSLSPVTPSPMPSSPIEWSPSPPPTPGQPPNEPAPDPSVLANTSTSTSTSGSQRSRGQARRGVANIRGISRRGRGGANVGNENPTSHRDARNQPANEESAEPTLQNKKGRNRGMNAQEKLVLIRE